MQHLCCSSHCSSRVLKHVGADMSAATVASSLLHEWLDHQDVLLGESCSALHQLVLAAQKDLQEAEDEHQRLLMEPGAPAADLAVASEDRLEMQARLAHANAMFAWMEKQYFDVKRLQDLVDVAVSCQ